MNHGLSKSRGVRKRRLGGILCRDLAHISVKFGAGKHKRVWLYFGQVDTDDLDQLLDSLSNQWSSRPYLCIGVFTTRCSLVSQMKKAEDESTEAHTYSAILIAHMPVPHPTSNILN